MNKELSYICTIGPSMANLEILENMYEEGMTAIRFNMSYKHPKMTNLLKIAQEFKAKHPDIELIFDSAGPEIRILLNNDLYFKKDDILVIGKDFELTVNNAHLLSIGDLILIKDGDFCFEIIETALGKIKCRALEDGVIKNNNKIYNEKMYDALDFMSEYDEEVIKSAVLHNIDSFAISFVRSKENISEVKKAFKKYGKDNIKIIAKIENKASIENINEIIDVSDEIMIARGDLSTILPRTTIAYYQKMITKKCLEANKTVIIATGILSSMEKDNDPEISEILDLYNILLDGVKKIVFTGETSVAQNPIDVLKTANEIAYTATISKEL